MVVQRSYDLLLWLLPKVKKFPRSFRFSVGDGMVTVRMDLLLALVDAAYSSEKTASLDQASRRVNAGWDRFPFFLGPSPTPQA